jgi:phosphatidylserine synthase 2
MDSIDFYIVAHLLGWIGKMLIIRDVKMAWVLSIVFELIELSLKHHLPNFCECWWDSLVLDILLFNGGGIFIGLLICRWFKLRRYSWDELTET